MKQINNNGVKKSKTYYNRISIADFEIESTTEDLETIAKCLDDMIEKHNKFVDGRNIINSIKHLGIG